MFRTLAEEGINIQMISTSEIKITVVIEEKYTELAVRVLHKASSSIRNSFAAGGVRDRFHSTGQGQSGILVS